MAVAGRLQEDLGAVGRSRADAPRPRRSTPRAAVPLDDDPRHGAARRVGLQPHHLGVDQQGDVGLVEQRAHRDDLGVGLGVHQARVAVAPGAADAGAAAPVGLVEHDPDRSGEGMVAARLEGVADLLQAGLVADRRPRIGLGPVALGRVLIPGAVHLVEPLGLGVPRLEVVVAERPGRRQPVHVLDLPEVLGPQPVEGGAVELGRAARRSSGPGAGTACRALSYQVSGEMYLPSMKTASGFQLSISRAGSRPARAAGSACRTGPGCGPACRRRRRSR